MNGIRQLCHCGHDRATHYVDRSVSPPEIAGCLAVGECTCSRYVYVGEPKPKATGKRPPHANWCQCYACKEYYTGESYDNNGPDTPRIPFRFP